jgi:tetratricopeptide (TPR) repeat protein
MPALRPAGFARLQLLFAWLGVGLLDALTLADRGATRMYVWPWIFYLSLLFALPPLLWLAQLLAPGAAPPARFGGWLDAALLGGAALNLLAALASPYPHQSLRAAVLPLAGVACAYLLLGWLAADPAARAARLERGARFLGWFLAAVLLDSLGLWLADDLRPAWQHLRTLSASSGEPAPLASLLSLRNEHPLGHANYTAGLALLMIPWFAALAGRARGRARAGWGVALALALLMLISSGSRGGLAALAVLAVGALILAARRRRVAPARLAGLALTALAAAGLLSLLHPRVRLVLHEWRDTGTLNTGDRQRLSMIEAALAMTAARPVLGWGPGVSPQVYPRFRGALTGGVETAEQLHCTPAQLAADLGVPGLLVFLLLAGGIGARLLRLGDPDAPPAESAWVPRAAGLALLGYGAFSFTDFQLDVPVFTAALAACLALLGAGPSSPRLSAAARRWLALGCAGGLGAWLFVAVPLLRARWQFSRAVDALEQGDYPAFDRRCAVAVETAPWDLSLLNSRAWAAAETGLQAEDPARRARLLARALGCYEQSLARNPAQELCHFNLGWLMVKSDPRAAAAHFRAAARLVPDKGGVYFGLGLALYNEGRVADAAGAFALECLDDPRFLTAPWWGEPPFAGLRPQVRARLAADYRAALAGLPPGGWLHREAAYAAALTGWLNGADDGAAAGRLATTPERAAFFAALPALDRRAYRLPLRATVWNGWQRLYAAWTGPAQRAAFLRPMAEETRDAFAAFLADSAAETFTGEFLLRRSPPPPERTLRNQRLAYGILRKNLDVPVPVDFYLVRENLVTTDYLGFLFPVKGWLPGPVLLGRLDAIAR